METFLFLFFIFGTMVGSFANVLVLRHGFKESKRARSGCSACGTQLKWYELAPIISFFALRGQCGSCGSRLSFQYPLVELVMGVLFVGVFYISYPLVDLLSFVSFILTLIFWVVFVVLTVYDMRHTLVPYAFSLPLIGVAFSVRTVEAVSLGTYAPLTDAVLGALILGGFLLLLFLLTRGRGMGLGDAYVGVALGFFFGIAQSFEVLAFSFWIGAIVGVVLLGLKKGFTIKTEVPFVPFLFFGAILGAFTGLSSVTLVSSLLFSL